jgi:DNA-binding NtrC family response regulator
MPDSSLSRPLPPAVRQRDGSGEARLLVVDDEGTILELLSGSLRLAGYEVITEASGMEAPRAAAASRPDLLLDVMMPDSDGIQRWMLSDHAALTVTPAAPRGPGPAG